MRWQIKSTFQTDTPNNQSQHIVKHLLNQRGFKTTSQQQEFLNPPEPSLKIALTQLPDFDQTQLNKAHARINKAINSHQPIIIYGDYDCDGISAATILWTALHQSGAIVKPFIPHRVHHGYGLSSNGVTDALSLFPNKQPLIITVDNGISAIKEAQKLKKMGLDLIITDHHTPPDILPPAHSIVHTTHLSGSGVAWLIASLFNPHPLTEFAALGTVCDLLPLTGFNRSLVKHGLEHIKNTSNPGLLALYQAAGIADTAQISTYHLGYILGPRINAVGRLSHALDALRLFCTTNQTTAQSLAHHLSNLNYQRQDLTQDHATMAINHFKSLSTLPNILVFHHPDFHEGIIGLVASRLTDHFHRPSIIISSADNVLKASARSVPGINITQLISQTSHLLTNYGGHHQAAGFSASPDHLQDIHDSLTKLGDSLDPKLLVKTLDIDLQLDPSLLSLDLFDQLSHLEPFGIANPQPIFASSLPVKSHSLIGKTMTHLKVQPEQPFTHLDVIGFNLASRRHKLSNHSSFAFSLNKNHFRGKTSLQLLVKDIK